MSKRVVHTSARSLERCRKLGLLAGKVERWVPMPSHPGGGKRMDFLGVFDIIAFTDPLATDERYCVAIQSCAMSGRAAHLAKMNESHAVISAWNSVPGHRAELWSWRKLKVKRGGKAVRWECEVTTL